MSMDAGPSREPEKKPKIRVLSLFDGIGTGFYALDQLNFDVECYYASEIDKNAIRVTCHHFGISISQLGCIKTIDEDVLAKIGDIDLLIGGSPCNDLSCVNSRRKKFYDINGTCLLFFEFYRIKNILDGRRKPYYWFFENVAGMETKSKNIISKFLGCEPYVINSGSLSAQKRPRYFWTNSSSSVKSFIEKPISSGPTLDEYLDKNLGRRANVDKVGTITTKPTCLQDGSSRNPVSENGETSGLYVTELEKIFGLPAHFTDVGNMNARERQKLLGRAWSVPVIKALFEPLTEFFATK